MAVEVLDLTDQNGRVFNNIYHVTITLEIYDHLSALAVDHLLNHLALMFKATSYTSSPLDDALDHPQLYQFKNRETGFSNLEFLKFINTYQEDCRELIDLVPLIVFYQSWPEHRATALRYYESLRSNVPYIKSKNVRLEHHPEEPTAQDHV